MVPAKLSLIEILPRAAFQAKKRTNKPSQNILRRDTSDAGRTGEWDYGTVARHETSS